MLAALLIVFREVIEAGLVVGIILAATEGIRHRGRAIGAGIAAGVAGACLLALCAGTLAGALSGSGQEIFNATVLSIAVLMLGWHCVWMARHGRELAADMKAVGHAVASGEKSLPAMAVVVAVAVLREGSEIVLFLYGIAASGKDSALSMLAGGVTGLVAGGALSFLLYRGLVAIPLKTLFRVTNILIALLAAGMAAQAAGILAGADLIPAYGYQLWDTSAAVTDGSLAGRTLHALFGYTDRPMGVQVMAWLTVAVILAAAMRLFNAAPRKPLAPSLAHS